MEPTDKRVPTVEQWEALKSVIDGAGGVTELTSADYNYPVDNPTSVALWLLEPGIYTRASDEVAVRYGTGNGLLAVHENTVLVTSPTASGSKNYLILASNNAILKIAHSTSSGSDSEIQMVLNGANVAQSTGTSTTDVMSQKATTSMVFADPGARYNVKIGTNVNAGGSDIVAIGRNAYTFNGGAIAIGGADDSQQRRTRANAGVAIGAGAIAGFSSNGQTIGARNVAVGQNAYAPNHGAIALGSFSSATTNGEMNIGVSDSLFWETCGYKGSAYRKISGVYDGENAHDAVNLQQLQTAILNGGTTAPTTTTVGAVGTLYSYVDTTGTTPEPHLMVCTVADTATPAYTWVDVMGSIAGQLNQINNGGA